MVYLDWTHGVKQLLDLVIDVTNQSGDKSKNEERIKRKIKDLKRNFIMSWLIR